MNTHRFGALTFPLYLGMLLAGCSSGDDNIAAALPVQDDVQGGAAHAPVLSDVYLKPSAAFVMQGDGTVEISTSIEYADEGKDVRDLRIAFSNGTELSEFVAHLAEGSSGSFWFQIDVSTSEAGPLMLDVSLVDYEDAVSNHVIVEFRVLDELGAWVERVSGLPSALNDVLWTGFQFVAVGDDGMILTSPDGIVWTEQESGTTENLHAIGFDFYDYIVVGDEGTVLSSGGGGIWLSQNVGPENVSLLAVAHHAWPVIVAGKNLDTNAAIVMRSMDHGETWEEIENLPPGGRFVTDLVGGPGQYVATTGQEGQFGNGSIWRSYDGRTWAEVAVSPDLVQTLAIIYGEGEYWVGGTAGSLFKSADGIDWTEMRSPAEETDLQGIARLGPLVVAHGRNRSWTSRPVEDGVSTPNGGATWHTFQITADFAYETRGMAFGAGRFVSVGRSLEAPGEGAIFSTE